MNWYKKAIRERIPGGRAEGKDPKKYDSKQMEIGEEIEYEHTPIPGVSKEIARDHLEEFPTYYTGLTEMERKLEKKKPAERGLYPGQQIGDENRPGDAWLDERILDNEVAEGKHVATLHRMAEEGDLDGFGEYAEELKRTHSLERVNSIMNRAWHGIRL